MMKSNYNRRLFYAVQFVELPFEDIDDCVCVPHSWIIRRASDQKVVVAYPKDEDPFVTRDRVKRRERYDEHWRSYMAVIKYTSDTYSDVEYWIATRNDYGPTVEDKSRMMDEQRQSTGNKKLRSAQQNHFSESKNDKPQLTVKSSNKLQEPLPILSLKRRAQSKPKKQFNEKRLKLNEAVNDSKNQQSMGNAQTIENAEVSNSDYEVQPNRVMEPASSSSQIYFQFTKQPKSVQEQEISVVSFTEKTCNDQEIRTNDVSNNGSSTLHHLPNSLKMSAQICNHMIGKPTLVANQESIKKKILLKDSSRNLAIASQNPSNLMNPTGSMTEQPPMMIQNHSQSVSQSNSTNVPNQLYQFSELSEQQQPCTPIIRFGISIKPKNNRKSPTLQEVTKRTISCLTSKVRNSNEYIVEKSSLPDHGVSSDSEAGSDCKIISDYDVSTDEAPVKIKNDVCNTEILIGSNSAGRPMTAQNLTSTKQPMHPRAALEQQMLDQFAALFSQMGTTLKHTSTMYSNLRRSILECADTYKRLLEAVETFNALSNLASASCSSSHMAPEVPEVVQERHSGVAWREDSSDDDQHNDNAVNEAPSQEYNSSWRFVLPPEYDPRDSKWTLKYRQNMPGLVELMPGSGVYVSYRELKYAQRVSNDCETFARRLLPEVFSKRALSVCLSMNEKPSASNNAGSQVRPSLDTHASMILFNSVLKYGLERGWNIDTKDIINSIHRKVQQMRFKYGVMAKF